MTFPNIKIPTWIQTVTVLNRRAGRDSPDGLDIWTKTVLHNCFWAGNQARGQSGQEISESASCLLRAPKDPQYRPYPVWKADMEGFTFSPGDYIILGEVTEEINPETVRQVVDQYWPDAFEVRMFKDNTGGPLPHYRLEGV